MNYGYRPEMFTRPPVQEAISDIDTISACSQRSEPRRVYVRGVVPPPAVVKRGSGWHAAHAALQHGEEDAQEAKQGRQYLRDAAERVRFLLAKGKFAEWLFARGRFSRGVCAQDNDPYVYELAESLAGYAELHLVPLDDYPLAGSWVQLMICPIGTAERENIPETRL